MLILLFLAASVIFYKTALHIKISDQALGELGKWEYLGAAVLHLEEFGIGFTLERYKIIPMGTYYAAAKQIDRLVCFYLASIEIVVDKELLDLSGKQSMFSEILLVEKDLHHRFDRDELSLGTILECSFTVPFWKLAQFDRIDRIKLGLKLGDLTGEGCGALCEKPCSKQCYDQ